MLTFIVSAWFKADANQNWDVEHPGAYIQHLKTFVPQINFEGALVAPTGSRCGIFAMLTSPTFEEGDRFVASSRYQLAGVDDRVDIHRTGIQSSHLT